MKLHRIALVFVLTIAACSPVMDSHEGTISSVMDNIITRLYAEVPTDLYSRIDEKFVLNFITEEEKTILATRYQYFTVNVPVVVSIMRDRNQAVIPFWLEPSGFERTDLLVKSESYVYEVWQKKFDAGLVELGINGFDKHRPVYFVSVAPQQPSDRLVITDYYPAQYALATLEEGAFTYHDWSDLLLVEVPSQLRGQQMFTTVRGRAREAHIKEGFRNTPYPSTRNPDQIMLTWSASPETTVDIQWRTDTTVADGQALVWPADDQPADTLSINALRYRLQDRMLVNDRYIHRFTAKATGLSPGKRYHYRVGSAGADTWSPVESFQTASSDPAFSFIWFGDTHCFPDSGKLVSLTSRHEDIAFYTIAGDIVSTGLNRDDWDRFFKHAGNAFGRKPLMPVPGNHDRQDGLGAKMYYDLFSLPKNGPKGVDQESTYAFEYGNALFLMIDATSDWDAHSPWIEDRLSASRATWKFAVFHFPPYNFEEPYPELQEKWVPLFDRYHVDMVMGGHIHYYMRSQPMNSGRVVPSFRDGTVYAISISIPWNHDQITPEPYAVVQYPQGYFYQVVDIEGGVLHYKAYDQTGLVRDAFSIRKD